MGVHINALKEKNFQNKDQCLKMKYADNLIIHSFKSFKYHENFSFVENTKSAPVFDLFIVNLQYRFTICGIPLAV